MSSYLTCDPQAIAAYLNCNTSDQEQNLGERVVTADGRVFRYAKAGDVALVPGTLVQSAAEATGNENLAVLAAAIGDVLVTTSTTVTVTANQYAGGYMLGTVTPGQGYQYKIKSHPAASGAVLVLTLEDPLAVALTTASRVDLVANPFNGVIINPASASGTPVGVAISPISIGNFGWVQTGGIANVLADGTVTVGTTVVASNGTAGAVEPFAGVQQVVGIAATGIATTEYGAIKLLLDQ